MIAHIPARWRIIETKTAPPELRSEAVVNDELTDQL